MTLEPREYIENRMRQRKAEALIVLRSLPASDLTAVLLEVLPQRIDMNRSQVGALLEVLGPLHHEAWRREIEDEHKRIQTGRD